MLTDLEPEILNYAEERGLDRWQDYEISRKRKAEKRDTG